MRYCKSSGKGTSDQVSVIHKFSGTPWCQSYLTQSIKWFHPRRSFVRTSISIDCNVESGKGYERASNVHKGERNKEFCCGNRAECRTPRFQRAVLGKMVPNVKRVASEQVVSLDIQIDNNFYSITLNRQALILQDLLQLAICHRSDKSAIWIISFLSA